jgi:hypothetical protein
MVDWQDCHYTGPVGHKNVTRGRAGCLDLCLAVSGVVARWRIDWREARVSLETQEGLL